MYTIERCVRYSDCGADGKLTLANVINYFQDCSTAQSEHLGVGVGYMKKQRRAWILVAWQICINRIPELHEEVITKTWPTSFKTFFGTRNYVLESKDGETLVYANSIWTYLDIDAGRPAKIPQEEIDIYGVEPEFPMEHAPRKIRVGEGGCEEEKFRVYRYHLDTNNHVNNGKYIEMAMEYIPETVSVKQVRVEYKKSALYGDVIVPKVTEEEERKVVELRDEAGIPYAVVEIIGEEKR